MQPFINSWLLAVISANWWPLSILTPEHNMFAVFAIFLLARVVLSHACGKSTASSYSKKHVVTFPTEQVIDDFLTSSLNCATVFSVTAASSAMTVCKLDTLSFMSKGGVPAAVTLDADSQRISNWDTYNIKNRIKNETSTFTLEQRPLCRVNERIGKLTREAIGAKIRSIERVYTCTG